MMRNPSLIAGALLTLACAGRAAAQEPPAPPAPQQLDAQVEAPAPVVVPAVPPAPAAAVPPPAPARALVAPDPQAAQPASPEDAFEAPVADGPLGRAGRLAVGATVDVLWYLDTAHDAFSKTREATPAGGLSASLTIVDFGHRLLLDVGAGWHAESSTAAVLQRVSASYDANAAYVDATLRFELMPWFAPRARVSLGAQYLSASLAPDDGGVPLEGGAFSLVTSVGVGLELLARLAEGLTRREGQLASVALSLVVEGGIVLGTPSTLTVTPREPRDDEALADRIPVVGTDIGSLGGIAPYLRVSGVVRF